MPIPRRYALTARLSSIAAIAIGSTALIAAAAPSATAAPSAEWANRATVATPAAERWSLDQAKALRRELAASADEGLRPADYGAEALDAAIAGGRGPALDAAADAAALALARDYAQGRITDRSAFDWHIERSPYETADLPARLAVAVDRGEVRSWLRSLLPQDARYAALRAAYRETPAGDAATLDTLRANMERWRWLPRSFGDRYVYVNVPSYQLSLMEGGDAIKTYDVVVGAPKTPTPVLAAPASSVVVNPWWNVPQSIVKSSNLYRGKPGYVFKTNGSGYLVRQAPGPRNALGQIKIDMPNEHAIYLHDTPAKAAFARTERALSHGCIRVKNVDQLAADMLAADEASVGRLDEALATRDTTTIRMARQWPVYLVYFTADRAEDGSIRTYGDPYGRDAQLLAALDRASPPAMQMASR
ncbi:MAG: L,D-transpeptidase family protein [Sphingomonas fennica]